MVRRVGLGAKDRAGVCVGTSRERLEDDIETGRQQQS